MTVQSSVSRSSAAPEQEVVRSLEDSFARYQSELLGTLYYLLGNREDARDALQEAFLKCWKHRAKIPEIENMKAWIFRIAVNTGRDLRGSAWKRRHTPFDREDEMVDAAPAPRAAAERNEEMENLRSAIMGLRPEEKEVFLLRQNGGLTYEQIGLQVGIPLGTVKTRMRLAIGRLQKILARPSTR